MTSTYQLLYLRYYFYYLDGYTCSYPDPESFTLQPTVCAPHLLPLLSFSNVPRVARSPRKDGWTTQLSELGVSWGTPDVMTAVTKCSSFDSTYWNHLQNEWTVPWRSPSQPKFGSRDSWSHVREMDDGPHRLENNRYNLLLFNKTRCVFFMSLWLLSTIRFFYNVFLEYYKILSNTQTQADVSFCRTRHTPDTRRPTYSNVMW